MSGNDSFDVSIVSADGLALLGARTSAGTVMTNFSSCVWDVYVYGIGT